MVKRSNVLLVEDDRSVRDALTKVLTVENYTVHSATTGREAVAVCSQTRMEVVILDLNLGPEDGWNIFETLRQISPNLPIIVTSAHGHRLVHTSASRANGLLEKPFDLSILLAMLRQAETDLTSTRETTIREPGKARLLSCWLGAALLSLSFGSAQAAQSVPTPFHVDSLTVANGQAVVQWRGGNSLNQVQSTTNLTTGPWVDVDAPTANHSVTSICSAPMAFYRVLAFSNNTGDSTPPSVPTGLSVSLATSTEASLSWNASYDSGTGVKGYNIYRNGVFLKQTDTPYAGDSGLAAGVQYSYQVAAIDRAGNPSARSSSFALTPGGGCAFGLTPANAGFASSGGSGAVTVTAGSSCAWTAVTGDGWITITSGAQGQGNGSINYSVAANTSAASRSGSIVVQDQSFSITQAGVGGPDTSAPTASFLGPISGATVTGTIQLSAQVTDNANIARVEFYVDSNGNLDLAGTSQGSGTLSTASVVYDTTKVLNGQHTIYCHPFDTAGNSSWAWVTVNISNDTPDPGNLIWAQDVGRSPVNGEVSGTAVKTDSQGNLVVVGKFAGTVTVGGTSITSRGGHDIFVAKYSSAGSPVWVKTFGGAWDDAANSVAVDGGGNIFLTGSFLSTVDFGGGLLSSDGGNNNGTTYILKLSSTGAHVWSRRFGGSYGNSGVSIAVDRNNDVLIAGQYNFQVDVGGGVMQSAGGLDGYIVKYSGQTGTYVWGRSFGGSAADYPQGLAVDGNGDMLVTGYSNGSMDFGGGLRASAGGSDAFLVKYAGANGAHVWSKMIGGLGNESGGGIAVDSSGNGVLAGSFTQTLNLGGVTLSAPLSTAMFIAKYDAGSGALQWAKSVGGSSSIGGSVGPRVAAVDSAGNVVVTGNATGEADFGNGVLTAGAGNTFIAKYSPTGSYLWAKRISSTGWCAGMGLAVDAARNVIGTGGFSGTADFDGTQLSSASLQTSDVYLVKISP